MRALTLATPEQRSFFTKVHPEYVRERAPGCEITMMVYHHTGGHYTGDWPILTGQTGRWVSVHYYITRTGTIWHLTEDRLRASHAGESIWQGMTGPYGRSVNDISLGVEFESTGYNDYTEVQYEAGIWLAYQKMHEYDIALDNIVGHKDVSPGRKWDPGLIETAWFQADIVRYGNLLELQSADTGITTQVTADDLRTT